jgi:CMP-N-acetylneuraminic acid synthetase
MKKSICIIPARGGSKRIPRKNILPLNGKPLLAYSIDAAKDAGVFDKIVVSTEDQEIKEIALACNVEVDDRPDFMAGDRVTKVEVVKEYIQRNAIQNDYDYVAALLPTCPFRSADDIKNAYQKLLSNTEHHFLIGVTEYEFPVGLALEKEGELVKMISPEEYQVTRSQNKSVKYHPNGAIYLASMQGFLSKGTFFNEEMLHYIMPALRSFDIDYTYQFEIAKVIAENKFHEQIH